MAPRPQRPQRPNSSKGLVKLGELSCCPFQMNLYDLSTGGLGGQMPKEAATIRSNRDTADCCIVQVVVFGRFERGKEATDIPHTSRNSSANRNSNQ